MTRFVRGMLVPLCLAATVLFWAGPSWSGGGKSGTLTKEQEKQLSDTLREVINKGAKLFNEQGDYPACYRLYEGAALTVRPLLGQYPGLQGKIDSALSEASAHPSVVQKAFLVRKALDEVRKQLGGGTEVIPPPTGKDKVLKFTAQPASVKIKAGEKKDVQIAVARGKDLQGDITLNATSPTGIAIGLAPKVGETEKSFKVSISSKKDAAPGKAKVKVTGMCAGVTAEATIDVEIEKGAVQPPPAPGTASITGKVTLDGKPLPGGSVGFVPTDAKAQVKLHVALLKADGSYSFAEGEVPPGTYMVGVGPPDKLPAGTPKIEIPKKYQAAVNSPLTYMVKPGAQTFDIKLESDKKPVNPPPPPPPAKTTVSGKVTLKGKPLAGGQVHFFASDGKKSAVASIGADGTFSLDKGLTAGAYLIAITPAPGQPKTAIPEKYQLYSTSALKFEVKAGPNQMDLNLP